MLMPRTPWRHSNQGRLLFDVTANGEKLNKFVNQHPQIRSSIWKDTRGTFPKSYGFLEHRRPVYFGAKSK